MPLPTQLLLADPQSIAAKRAAFATHHLWITRHRDGEFWAAGEFTNQSQFEAGGVQDAVARNDSVEDADVVLWSVFGITHNPRVEDWPVMPVERLELSLRPGDFFEGNPALDVPGGRGEGSVEVGGDGEKVEWDCCARGEVQELAERHFQGSRDVQVNGDGVNGNGTGNKSE